MLQDTVLQETANPLVKKANALISSKLKGYSLVQLKLFNFSVSQINKMDDLASIDIPAKTLFKALNNDSDHNYARLRKATLGMIKGIELPMPDGSVNQVPIFHSFKYLNGGIVKVRFHEEIVPYILQRNKYSQYYYQNIRSLNSKYSLMLYELCKQYEPTAQKFRVLSLKELRFFLDIDDKTHKTYAHLKSRVIEPAVIEVSRCTDISITYDEIKSGRKVSSLKFYIKPKKNVLITGEDIIGIEDDKEPELFSITLELQAIYFFSKKQALEIQELAINAEVLEYCKPLLEAKIAKKSSAGEIDNVTSYARAILLTDIQTALDTNVIGRKKEAEQKELLQKQREQQEREDKVTQVRLEQKRKAEREAVNAKYKVFCDNTNLLSILTECALDELVAVAKEEIKPDILKLANDEITKHFGADLEQVNALIVFGVLSGQLVIGQTKQKHVHNIKNFFKVALKSLYID